MGGAFCGYDVGDEDGLLARGEGVGGEGGGVGWGVRGGLGVGGGGEDAEGEFRTGGEAVVELLRARERM